MRHLLYSLSPALRGMQGAKGPTNCVRLAPGTGQKSTFVPAVLQLSSMINSALVLKSGAPQNWTTGGQSPQPSNQDTGVGRGGCGEPGGMASSLPLRDTASPALVTLPLSLGLMRPHLYF